MADLPCINPNCNSHGKPHPNCRCYGFAKGGRISGFCSDKKVHKKDCEYYLAKGGEIDPSQVVVDQPSIKSEQIDPQQVQVDPDIPHDAVELDSEKYSSTEQQIKTGLEGAAQGVLGPLAPYIETEFLGVKPEDIKRRERENPLIHGGAEAATLAGSMLTGVGEAGLIAKGAGALAKSAELGKVGSAVLKGIIEGASFTGSDELTKAILNQPGSDPETPASSALLHVGAAGLMGGIGGSVFGLGEKMIGRGLEKLENKKIIDGVQNFLSKLGGEGNPLDKLGITRSIKTAIDTTLYPIAGEIGKHVGIPPGMAYGAMEKLIEKPLSKITGKLNKYSTDAIIHSLLTNSSEAVPNAVHYANNILRGAQKTTKAMDAIFMGGTSQIAEPVSEEMKKQLKDFVEAGQVDQQMENSISGEAHAKGGLVGAPTDHFSKAFPEQNMILSSAKGRVAGYLNSIRPLPNQPKLPFDKVTPEKEKHRAYDKAIGFAVNPMQILERVNKGNLAPDDMKHFTSMYPEIYRHLSKEMTKRIIGAQLKEESPPYKKRQAMSLFLGAALDSTFSPSAISTIQGMYGAKTQEQQPQVQKPNKSTSPLSKLAPSAMTDAQARTNREQNQKA